MSFNYFKSFSGAKKTAKQISLLMIGMMISFTACQVDEMSNVGDENAPAIDFKTQTETRSADESLFEVGDSIGIYSVQWLDNSNPGQLVAQGNRQDNCAYYLMDNNDTWESQNPVMYPYGGGYIDLYAYYPYAPEPMNSDATIKLAVTPDQSKVDNYKHSDFKAAVVRKLNHDSGTFHFDFYHRLSQVTFELIAGSGVMIDDLLPAQIKLKNVITDGSYSFTDGNPDKVTTGTTRADVIPCGSFEKVGNKLVGKAVIVMPQTLTASTELEITVESTVESVNFSEPVELRSGESRVIAITLNSESIDFTTEIKPWDEQPPMPEAGIMATFDIDCTDSPLFILNLDIEKEIEIDWGDGTENTKLKSIYTENVQHTYDLSNGKTFRVKIYGDKDAIISIDNDVIRSRPPCICGTIDFSGCTNLKKIDLYRRSVNASYINLTNCPSLEVFTYCSYNSGNQTLKIDMAQSHNLKEIHIIGQDTLIHSGLENHPLLESINITSDICEIDLSHQPNLKNLSLNCDMERVDISNNPLLESLSLSGCLFVREIDTSKNPLLRNLNLRYTEISMLDLSKITKLESLTISHTSITNIDLSKVPNLYWLVMDVTPITQIDLSPLTKLQYFDCNHSDVETLDFSSNPVIDQINCGMTRMSSNKTNLLAMAESLPDRQNVGKGIIYNKGVIEYGLIEDICNSKNWQVRYTSQ